MTPGWPAHHEITFLWVLLQTKSKHTCGCLCCFWQMLSKLIKGQKRYLNWLSALGCRKAGKTTPLSPRCLTELTKIQGDDDSKRDWLNRCYNEWSQEKLDVMKGNRQCRGLFDERRRVGTGWWPSRLQWAAFICQEKHWPPKLQTWQWAGSFW